ncbi:MAG: LysR family transcriptional regulator [Eubacterium sp.]|nr:LysR family transcriptional regulator [Eubacterium sp.]
MDLRQLNYFLTIAEELNITKASKRLNISQPPLSRALMDLEDELGCKLFVRGKRRLSLTPEGMALKRRSTQILDLTRMTKSEIIEMKSGIGGTIHLGLVDSNGPFLVADWISAFKEEYPNVTYSLWSGNSDDLTDRLKEGLLDLALTMTPFNSEILDGFQVFEENWVAIIPNSHELAQKRREYIKIKELADTDLIIPSRHSRSGEINQWFAKYGIEPRFLIEIAHSSNAIQLVSKGLGIAIFPASVAKNIPSVAGVTVKELSPTAQVGYILTWDNQKKPGVLAGRFVEFVREMYAEVKE